MNRAYEASIATSPIAHQMPQADQFAPKVIHIDALAPGIWIAPVPDQANIHGYPSPPSATPRGFRAAGEFSTAAGFSEAGRPCAAGIF